MDTATDLLDNLLFMVVSGNFFVLRHIAAAEPDYKRSIVTFNSKGIDDSVSTVEALIKAGADVTATNMFKDTPLHLAKCPDIVMCLLENGAQINAQDFKGRTPLLASMAGTPVDEKVIESLLFAGADIDIPDKYGQTFKIVYEDKKLLFKFVSDTMEKFRVLKIRSDVTKHFDKTSLKTYELKKEIEIIKDTYIEGTCLYNVFNQTLQDFVFSKDSIFRKIIQGDDLNNTFPHFHVLIKLSFRKAERNYFLRELSEMFSCKLTNAFQLNVPTDVGYLIIGFLNAQDMNNLKLALQ